jgi:glyoxylase-like metal-dependent hydrolase (beta-lactamase superfamily II)
VFKNKKPARLFALLALFSSLLPAQMRPEWCRELPRPEYRGLQQALAVEPWFEVYKVTPDVFAIYEPHQAEETISYLIPGKKQAVLFDTGMGIGDLHSLVKKLTNLPVIVLNSHTHNDHVGDNWQFETVYGMDTDFTRRNALGSRDDAQAEVAPGMICGAVPKDFVAKDYETRPWKISKFLHGGEKVDLGGRTLEVIATPGHTPDAISLLDRDNGLLFTGDTYYPAPIWLYRPETDLDAYVDSVRKLAALTPQLEMVFGAHNVPIAQPTILPKLVAAIEEVRAGKIRPEPQEGGKALYHVGEITFLMRMPGSEKSPQVH